MHRFFCLNDAYPNPSRSYFAKSHIVRAYFFSGFYRQRIAGGPIINRKDQDTDDLSFQIQHRRSCFAALRRDVCSNKGCTEILIEIFEVKSSDHSKRWRYGEIHWITDRDNRRSELKFVGISSAQPRRTPRDLKDRDAAACIAILKVSGGTRGRVSEDAGGRNAAPPVVEIG